MERIDNSQHVTGMHVQALGQAVRANRESGISKTAEAECSINCSFRRGAYTALCHLCFISDSVTGLRVKPVKARRIKHDFGRRSRFWKGVAIGWQSYGNGRFRWRESQADVC